MPRDNTSGPTHRYYDKDPLGPLVENNYWPASLLKIQITDISPSRISFTLGCCGMEEYQNQMEVLVDMFKDRGYTQIKCQEAGQSPTLICCARDTEGELCLAFFSSESRVGVKLLRQVLKDSKHASAKRVLLLSPHGLTPFAEKERLSNNEQFENTSSPFCETFTLPELSFNVTRHHLVPSHTRLPEEEIRSLLNSLKCDVSSLPRIKPSDPVVRYYGWPVGAVIRIHRSIGSLESSPYYRAVAT